jgi:hypothetical protein
MQGLLITIAVILIGLWIISLVFHLLAGIFALLIHLAPVIAVILIIYILVQRKNSI